MIIEALRGSSWMAALLLVASLVGVGTTLVIPDLTSSAVGALSDGRQGPVLALGIALTIGVVASATGVWTSAAVVARSAAAARRMLLDRLVSLESPHPRQFGNGDLVGRVISDAQTAGAMVPSVISACCGLVTAAGGMTGLALLDLRLAAAYTVTVPLATYLSNRNLRSVRVLFQQYRRAQSEISTRIVEALHGAATIRAAGTLDREVTRVLEPLPDLRRTGTAFWSTQARLVWQTAVLTGTLEVTVLAVAGVSVSTGRLTVADMVAAAGYVALAATLFRRTDVIGVMAAGTAAARRIADVIGQESTPLRSMAGAPLPAGCGPITLHQVTVLGEAGPRLDGITVEIAPGRLTVVVGRAGAGKSTFASVVGGLISPHSGEVRLAGVLVGSIRPGHLNRFAAYAFEQPRLLGGTVADAIAYGIPDGGSRAQVERAARAAAAHEFICELPLGYDTPLGSAPLSGGQTQRIGIARAIAQDARLVIVDDAMAGLDSLTEEQVLRSITEPSVERTALVITHRESVAARADTVIWLDGGRVRGIGRHGTLINQDDYRRLFARSS
ncbi:ATP-binding cassette domain-containing protein [Micromonospora sp. NPDC000212]|uniref:ATP-binding cassette domain-containing protein n=1 Tax=Micromonospora sp. NPDC000212 TaxID=3364215 RepID=UPI0036758DC8